MFWLRFLIGGLIVASIPEIARRFSPRVAGIIVLVPAITALSLYFVAEASGKQVAQQVARGALLGLVPLAIFLFAFMLTVGKGQALAATVFALAAWMAGAGLLMLAR